MTRGRARLGEAACVTITNCAGVAAEAIAELALVAMLHFATGRPQLARDQMVRRWQARMTRPMTGSTLLCIGLGQRGRRMAALGKVLGMDVLGVRASAAPTETVDRVFAREHLHDAMAVPLSTCH